MRTFLDTASIGTRGSDSARQCERSEPIQMLMTKDKMIAARHVGHQTRSLNQAIEFQLIQESNIFF
jgi:hypothetical protein